MYCRMVILSLSKNPSGPKGLLFCTKVCPEAGPGRGQELDSSGSQVQGCDGHPTDARVEEVIGGDGATGADHNRRGELLLDAFEFLLELYKDALVVRVDVIEGRAGFENGPDPEPADGVGSVYDRKD